MRVSQLDGIFVDEKKFTIDLDYSIDFISAQKELFASFSNFLLHPSFLPIKMTMEGQLYAKKLSFA